MTRAKKRQATIAENRASAARMEAAKAEAQRVVATGQCPLCGLPLRRNSSLTGWWQCVACCAPSCSPPEHRDKPRCSFQCFTE